MSRQYSRHLLARRGGTAVDWEADSLDLHDNLRVQDKQSCEMLSEQAIPILSSSSTRPSLHNCTNKAKQSSVGDGVLTPAFALGSTLIHHSPSQEHSMRARYLAPEKRTMIKHHLVSDLARRLPALSQRDLHTWSAEASPVRTIRAKLSGVGKKETSLFEEKRSQRQSFG